MKNNHPNICCIRLEKKHPLFDSFKLLDVVCSTDILKREFCYIHKISDDTFVSTNSIHLVEIKIKKDFEHYDEFLICPVGCYEVIKSTGKEIILIFVDDYNNMRRFPEYKNLIPKKYDKTKIFNLSFVLKSKIVMGEKIGRIIHWLEEPINSYFLTNSAKWFETNITVHSTLSNPVIIEFSNNTVHTFYMIALLTKEKE